MKDYDLSSIHEYLLMQEDNYFELVMNFPSAPMPGKYFLHILYHEAAYFGHRLSHVADTFSYNVPIDNMQPIFKFRVLVPDVYKLAEVIFTCLQAYFIEIEPDTHQKYYDDQDKFWDDGIQGLIKTRVSGLLETGNNYLKG